MPAVSWSPSPEFAFSRSYIVGITYVSDADYATLADNLILSGFMSMPQFLAIKVLFENWLPWNSNRYTLDHLVLESYYTPDGGPTIIQSTCGVNFVTRPGTSDYYIQIVDLPGGANTYYFDLPPSPTDYWLNNP